MRQRLQNFFAGRNGVDSLSRLTLWGAVIFVVVALFTEKVFGGILSNVLRTLGMALLVYTYWRMLSRNIYKRSAENSRYISATSGVRTFFRDFEIRISQRKDFKFFRCPSCRTMLRVPRGKGKIQITCRKCGNRFQGKT